MEVSTILFGFLFATCVLISNGQYVDNKQVKCLVCKASLDEMMIAAKKIDPKKIVEVSGFRIDAKGNSVTKTVPLAKSETYLTELMENVCDKMDDYAKALYKSDGRLIIMKMITDTGMHPDMHLVDFVQDGDLNKSLKHYCLEVLDDMELPILEHFMADTLEDGVQEKICTTVAGFCSDDSSPSDNDDDEEEADNRDEL